MRIILASASAGRRKLLESLGLKFEVMEPNVDEEKIVDADPVKMACKRAEAKAAAVAAEIQKQHDILIIGADTVGWLGKWIFNKPKSRKEAEEMLARLSGKTHKYISAHCLIKIQNSKCKTQNINHVIPAKAGILNHKTKIPDRALLVRNDNKDSIRNNPCLAGRQALEIRMNPTFIEKIMDYDVSSVTFRKLSKTDISFYLDRVEYLKLCGAFKIMGSPQNFVVKTEGSISNIIGLSLEKLIPVFVKNC